VKKKKKKKKEEEKKKKKNKKNKKVPQSMRIAINVFEVSIRLLRLSLCFCTGSCLRCTEKFSAGVVVVSQVYPQMKILPESISKQKFEYFDAYQ